MRFLSNLENNEKARTLIDCIIKMANRINMLTLTEGVETKVQAELLQRSCRRPEIQSRRGDFPVGPNRL